MVSLSLLLLHACGAVLGMRDPALQWSNFTWDAKEGLGDPGANLWVDTQDVVSGDGSFTIVISPPSAGQVPYQWKCGQVTSKEASIMGAYAFTVTSPVAVFDPNVRASMGVIKLNETEGLQHPVITMEVGRFTTSQDSSMKNARASVSTSQGVISKTFFVNSSNTTIWAFNWTQYRVSFQVSALESFETVPVTVFTWATAPPEVKPSNITRTMVSAYLEGHQPPSDKKQVQIVLKRLTVNNTIVPN